MSEFRTTEASIPGIHAGYLSGAISCERLVHAYLDRIAAFDRDGPCVNSIITLNPDVLQQARRLDLVLGREGLSGPLHGIPIIVKDQIDTAGMPTTLGSLLFENYFPDRDATVIEKVKAAGGLILGKATLGELGGGDTHGSLFGSTRNPYALERTAGGSSGGPAAALAANFGAVGIGQEGYASIRRPSGWNSVVGMRPSLGLVSRAGSFGGWPSRSGSLGPMTRSVEDAAILLDVLSGYDSADPMTAYGVGHGDPCFSGHLSRGGLRDVRVGVIRESIGVGSEPESADYRRVTEVFDRAVGELQGAGAVVVDSVAIPQLRELLEKRVYESSAESFMAWIGRSKSSPYSSYEELQGDPHYAEVMARRNSSGRPRERSVLHVEDLLVRDELRLAMLSVMAELRLDVIVHKTSEHSPPLIQDQVNPPYVGVKGVTHINTFLSDVPSISVPAGFDSQQLPVGITFLGRPHDDRSLIRYAYAYEQATLHRRAPSTTPDLDAA